MLGLSHLMSQEVRELVYVYSGTAGGGFWHLRLDIFEAIANSNILDYIAAMKNIGSPERN